MSINIKRVIVLSIAFLITISNFSIITAQSQNYDSSPIIYDTILPVIPNHNNLETPDRINIVFNVRAKENEYYSKFFRSNLPDLIGWNGPFVTKTDKEDVVIKRNFFATDPVRNNKHKFNVWVFYEKNSNIVVLRNFESTNNEIYNKMKNKVILTIDDTVENASFGTLKRNSNNSDIKLTEEENREYKDSIGKINLNNYPYLWMLSDKMGNILTHEFGHAIFNFSDEYATSLIDDYQYLYENKPKDLDELYQFAQKNKDCIAKLGIKSKTFGLTDPIYEEIVNDYESLGIKHNTKKIDYEVTYFDKDICSGKYTAEQIDNFGWKRSTIYSVMSSGKDIDYSIWGALKRIQIEKFLSEFNGYGDVIPYQKKVFVKSEIDKIINTPYKELYKDELKLVDQIIVPERYANEAITSNGNFIVKNLNLIIFFGILFLIFGVMLIFKINNIRHSKK